MILAVAGLALHLSLVFSLSRQHLRGVREGLREFIGADAPRTLARSSFEATVLWRVLAAFMHDFGLSRLVRGQTEAESCVTTRDPDPAKCLGKTTSCVLLWLVLIRESCRKQEEAEASLRIAETRAKN